MRTASRLWLLLVGLLAACATSIPTVREADNPPEVVDSWEEGCEAFRFNRHFDPKPPQPTLPPGRWVRHHIFSQALREWFHSRGVPDIHQFTLLIPEHVHVRIHGGGPSGGRWNQAWRDFIDARPNASPADIYRHAGELIFRFELTGTIVPYHRGGR